ncbi:hypothetical protein [Pseudonocardia sp.]|uniref:hypothetical protein n=1 Tax=Pseudonocardia sp. TaxID=60912 RepID=UPI002630C6D5|nr:hypothetical protein [Pseudonocardia sp.]
MTRPDRVLLILVVAVAVVAAVAGVLAAVRPVAEYDRATPEGVVQAYLGAVVDGDHDEAVRLLADGSRCTVVDLDRAYVPDGVRVVLRDARVTGDGARVQVDVARSSAGPFDGSEYVEEHTFRLTRTGTGWRVAGEPWPMYGCGGEG